MLSEELVIHLSGYLDIGELVSLGLTSRQWQEAIPDSVYQLVMMRHCPSFTPESTNRSSWQECARVHVSRLKNPDWMKSSHLFEMFHEVSLVEVTKNIPVPTGFVSFLDGHKAKLRKNCRHIEYLVGNGVKVKDTVIYLGSDKLGKRIGIEAVANSPLITPSGVLLSRDQLVEGTEVDRREVVTDNAIGYSSFETKEDGLCEAYMAVKLASSRDMYPDFGRKLQIRDPNMRIYPFVSKNRASMGVFLHTYLGAGFQAKIDKLGYVSFFNVYGRENFRKLREVTLEWEEGDHIVWRDGLILILRPGESSTLRVCFYDIHHQLEKFSTHTFKNCYGVKVSRDQNWVILLDKNRFIAKIWHLKTNRLLLIDPEDRRAITMVGTLGGKLIVSTYDADFISSNIPFSQRQKAVSRDFSMFSSASEETDDSDNVLWRSFRELRDERDAKVLEEKEREVKEKELGEQNVEVQEARTKEIGEEEKTKEIKTESAIADTSASLPAHAKVSANKVDSVATPTTKTGFNKSPTRYSHHDPVQTSGSCSSIFRAVKTVFFAVLTGLRLIALTYLFFLLAAIIFFIFVWLEWKLLGILISPLGMFIAFLILVWTLNR